MRSGRRHAAPESDTILDNLINYGRIWHKSEERTRRDTRIHLEQPTIPSTIGLEKTNTRCLWPLDASFIERHAATEGIAAAAVSFFAHIREHKGLW